MRSDLIFAALGPLQNRYELCQLVSKATRKFHRPNTRVEDTMNEVLRRFAAAKRAEQLLGGRLAAETLAETERRAA